jgi:SsrA-binding protein
MGGHGSVAPVAPRAAAKGSKALAQNRKARHDYEILETVECGIALVGSEVKSIRAGKAQLRDAYARAQSGELWLHGVHVAPYAFATGFGGHDPERPRKLLLHRRQIDELADQASQGGLALVPLSIYLNEGKVKVELALARGRKTYDKRHAIAARDAAREVERSSARDRRGGG